MPSYSGVWNLVSVYQAVAQGNWPSPPAYGLFGGGSTGTIVNVIDYINITATGNATDFGDLTTARWLGSACASSTRGVFIAGQSSNVIDYVSFASVGNATDFGDVTPGTANSYIGASSNSTRGVFAAVEASSTSNIINYITIATTGNSQDFGDLLRVAAEINASCASTTRALWGGEYNSGTGVTLNTIQYITIASTGNATDFGDLTSDTQTAVAVSSPTRGVFAGGITGNGGTLLNIISYVTIASTGNATDFGDLLAANQIPAGCSSQIRGVFSYGGFTNTNTMQYITMATTGNAASFGELSVSRRGETACSNAHGGL